MSSLIKFTVDEAIVENIVNSAEELCNYLSYYMASREITSSNYEQHLEELQKLIAKDFSPLLKISKVSSHAYEITVRDNNDFIRS